MLTTLLLSVLWF